MKHRWIRAALILFMAAGVVARTPPALSQAPNQPSRTLKQSVTEDLSEGRTFTFTIAANLPVFVFRLIPNAQPPDQFGNAQSTVSGIEVYRGDSKHALQHLSGCNLEEMQPPARGAEFFTAEDVNFDGYEDIFLQTSWGATGNASGCVWLFNPLTGNFDYSKEFSGLDRFWLNPSTKTLLTFERGGMLGLVHSAGKFAVENNRPVLIWSQFQDWDDSRNQFHCIIKQRRGSAMVVVRDEWGKRGEDDAPCDPSVLFSQLPSRK